MSYPTEPVRVFHLIVELSVGGAQSALARLLSGLDRERFSSQVACFYNGDGLAARQIRALGIPVTDLGMHSRYQLGAFIRLYRLLRRQHPTILHTWMFHANLAGRLIGRVAGVPIVVTTRRNVNIGGKTREMFNRWTASLDQKVIAVCEAARQAEIDLARVSPDKVVTIYNGLDVGPYAALDLQAADSIRRSLGIPQDALLLGAVGRLHPQKGYEYLLSAFRAVQERFPRTRLLIIGDGELCQSLKSQVLNAGLVESVVFAGVRADIPELLAAMDVFALASLWEGLPNVALEAMAAGLPVVATAVGGTPEVVVDGETGLLVPPGDPEALAQALNRLIADPDLRARMGQAGRQRVAEHFDSRIMLSKIQDLYNQLLVEE